MSENDKPKFINAKRRGFLQGAAVAGGAVASGAALSSEVESSEILPEAKQPAATANKGYEENDYVKRYYARARF